MWWCCYVDTDSRLKSCSSKWTKPSKGQSWKPNTQCERYTPLPTLYSCEFAKNWFNYTGLSSSDTPGGLQRPWFLSHTSSHGWRTWGSRYWTMFPGVIWASAKPRATFKPRALLKEHGEPTLPTKESSAAICFLLIEAKGSLGVPPTWITHKSGRHSNCSDRRESSNGKWSTTTSYPLGRLLRKQSNTWWRGYGALGPQMGRRQEDLKVRPKTTPWANSPTAGSPRSQRRSQNSQRWNQPQSPSTYEWINRMQCWLLGLKKEKFWHRLWWGRTLSVLL